MKRHTEMRPRAREIGLVLGSLPPGPRNAITDVDGVQVGHATVWFGDGQLEPGVGPARTGVTVILPHPGNLFLERVPAAYYQFNGFGKCVGIEQLDELGVLETPIALTSTLATGRVADGLISHAIAQNPEIGIEMATVNPFVAECNDGWLNDIQGRHVGASEVRRAIENACNGRVLEGSVGAGTGMSCFGFKGGIGTASRMIPVKLSGWTVGVLVLANFGKPNDLIIDGVPIGRLLGRSQAADERGSIVMVLATDAPMLDRQLKRLAKRAVLGLARTGSMGGHGSGDVVIAFSTAESVRRSNAADDWTISATLVAEDGPEGSSEAIDFLFRAAAESTEEAILNALFQATTVTGRDGHTRESLPLDRVIPLLEQYGRLNRSGG